jgi:hypothetical protein
MAEKAVSRLGSAFISYSRKDMEFVRKLHDALNSHGIKTWVDWEGIPTSPDWMEEIVRGIVASDGFIFVISPDSLASKVCAQELEEALKYNKKLLPILYREPGKGTTMHAQLAATNWVYMRSQDDFESMMPKLLDYFNQDAEWTHNHTILLQRAREWDQKSRNNSFLMRGQELRDAENWLIQSASAPYDRKVASLVVDYIQAGRKVEDANPLNRLVRGFQNVSQQSGSVATAEPGQKAGEANVQPMETAQPEEQPKAETGPRKLTDLELQEALAANLLLNNRAQAVSNDQSQGEDQLGIKNEVESLADTLLLRDVEPPVAVGVMGGWGGGKSFVMHLIRKRAIETRAKRVKKGWEVGENDPEKEKIPSFAGHIYQIQFNAWTYAKSNLWASLMQTIFFELNRQMRIEQLLAHRDFPKDGPRPKREDIRAKMMENTDPKIIEKIYAENLQIEQDKVLEPWRENLRYWGTNLLNESLLWNVMRKQQAETLSDLRNTEEQMKKLKSQREAFEKKWALEKTKIKINGSSAKLAYYQMLKNTMLGYLPDKLSEEITKQLEANGVDTENAKALRDETIKVLTGLNGILQAFRANRIYWIGAISLAIFSYSLSFVWENYGLPEIGRGIAQGAALAATVTPFVTTALTWGRKILDFNLEAKKALESAHEIEQAKEAEEIYTSEESMTFAEKVSKLQKKIAEGNSAAYDLLIKLMESHIEEQRRQIGPSAKYVSLLEFVQSRLDAGTYETQLGLMQQVRQDIDELTYSLVDNADPQVFPRGKPRILLYIDDLDRCPPSRVVEALEAVQLLLNTKLFIVVLGLDTRYVTRALEKEYKEILQHEGDPSGLDYIEKIIQVPYRVRPIEPDGLRNYLSSQMEIEIKSEPAPSAPAGADNPAQEKTETPASEQEPVKVAEIPAEEKAPATEKPVETVQAKIPEEKAESKPGPESDTSKKSEPQAEVKPIEIDLAAAVIQFKLEDLEDMNLCCQNITLTPRSIKRLVNVLKLMKIFWFRSIKDDRPRNIKQAAMYMLALSAAYPEVMREAFVQLETLYRQGRVQNALLMELNNVKLPPGSVKEIDWQHEKYKNDIQMLLDLEPNASTYFGQVTLAEFGMTTFNLVRSFSFVGDPVYWSNNAAEEDAREHRLEHVSKLNRN